jgi:uncharacterized Fe-S cluster-containing radical SAM superfamily protein
MNLIAWVWLKEICFCFVQFFGGIACCAITKGPLLCDKCFKFLSTFATALCRFQNLFKTQEVSNQLKIISPQGMVIMNIMRIYELQSLLLI